MFLSLIAVAAAMSLGTGHIAGADTLTGRSIADAYVSGELDPRIQELGSNAQTGESFTIWKSTQNGGLKRHCRFTYQNRGQSVEGCNDAFIRNGDQE